MKWIVYIVIDQDETQDRTTVVKAFDKKLIEIVL